MYTDPSRFPRLSLYYMVPDLDKVPWLDGGWFIHIQDSFCLAAMLIFQRQ